MVDNTELFFGYAWAGGGGKKSAFIRRSAHSLHYTGDSAKQPLRALPHWVGNLRCASAIYWLDTLFAPEGSNAWFLILALAHIDTIFSKVMDYVGMGQIQFI